MNFFDGTDDILDSRDVIERIEELTGEFIDATDSDPADVMSVEDWQAGLNEGDAEELAALIELSGEGISEWDSGAILIHEGYFTNYTRELLEDIGYLPADLPGWIVIDWGKTANNTKPDYANVEFRGTIYWVR